jgi:hypothetical protein
MWGRGRFGGVWRQVRRVLVLDAIKPANARTFVQTA